MIDLIQFLNSKVTAAPDSLLEKSPGPILGSILDEVTTLKKL